MRREYAGDRVVWRKTYSNGGSRRLRMAMLQGVVRALGTPPLRPPRPLDARAACRTEHAMIHRLAALGMRVPTIIEAGERHLLLSDLGETLAGACRREPDRQRRRQLVGLGLDELAQLHARGGWLSQAFARNLTVSDGQVGFIDLEQDPATVMSPWAAMARDVLLYAHSTARFLRDQPGAHAQLLERHLEHEHPIVRRKVLFTAGRLGWLLPLARRMGGRARGVTLALESLQAVAGGQATLPVRTDSRRWRSRIIRRPDRSGSCG